MQCKTTCQALPFSPWKAVRAILNVVGARESNRERKHFAARGPSAIRDAIAAAREFAADANIPRPDTARLAIVVEELVANLYDHGGLSHGDAVEIELSAGPN